jgi:sec-independent protein translocase protein TatA
VLLFGRGKISSLMGDVAKGIKSFKKGMASDVTDESEPKNISEDNQDSNNSNNKE